METRLTPQDTFARKGDTGGIWGNILIEASLGNVVEMITALSSGLTASRQKSPIGLQGQKGQLGFNLCATLRMSVSNTSTDKRQGENSDAQLY